METGANGEEARGFGRPVLAQLTDALFAAAFDVKRSGADVQGLGAGEFLSDGERCRLNGGGGDVVWEGAAEEPCGAVVRVGIGAPVWAKRKG